MVAGLDLSLVRQSSTFKASKQADHEKLEVGGGSWASQFTGIVYQQQLTRFPRALSTGFGQATSYVYTSEQ